MNGDVRKIQYSRNHQADLVDYPISDIDDDEDFLTDFSIARPYSMVGKEALYSLYQAVKYVLSREIPGDIVECGVWRGGGSLLAGLALKRFRKESEEAPSRDRRVWLYDTFEGMTAPIDADVDIGGGSARAYIEKYGDDGKWCYSDEDEVRMNLVAGGLSPEEFVLVKGDVLDTLDRESPRQISVLRLDTDWYESTKKELEVLYPLLSPGGVLIIDDYGHWQGARKAVDEYFETQAKPIFLQRTTYAVRTGVKI